MKVCSIEMLLSDARQNRNRRTNVFCLQGIDKGQFFFQDIAYAYLNEPSRPDPVEMDPQVAPANQRCYPETVCAVDKVHA